MKTALLAADLVTRAAERDAQALALAGDVAQLRYAELAKAVQECAHGLLHLGLERGDRVAVYLERRFETVIALFGASAAGGVMVPVNPALKAAQVAHILIDCGVRILVTSADRLESLAEVLPACTTLRSIVVTQLPASSRGAGPAVHHWQALLASPAARPHRAIDADLAVIFYTSGSTGRPKGVMVSHRNLLAGAHSVACYLENNAADVLLTVLPLSFDAGFSQLTTAFHAGARVALFNYLMPQDVVRAVERHRVTGLTAVPPLYIQLARLDWATDALASLRYFANTGGHLPREVLTVLRTRLPRARPFLMYGLTEAFRSTYLPPEEVGRRADSIGRAIPNAEVLVLRQDGSACDADEPGELVHRGALVTMGYWNDAEATALRYRALPTAFAGPAAGAGRAEIAVYSGDIVRADSDGYLYFVGRNDAMIKTSGYRVSPTEIEEVLYASGAVSECAVFGLADALLGQSIGVVVVAHAGLGFDRDKLIEHCRKRLPAYMVPAHWYVRDAPLPRNPNGKIDRNALATDCSSMVGPAGKAD